MKLSKLFTMMLIIGFYCHRLVTIYDSLNMNVTESLKSQITQLFSPDDALPPYRKIQCHKQCGNNDCGVFAIAYAVDVLLENEIQNIIYNQSSMRTHLISCLENQKLSPFPKYQVSVQNISSKTTTSPTESNWTKPRRSLRIKNKTKTTEPVIKLTNRFVAPEPENAPDLQVGNTSPFTINKKNHVLNTKESDNIVYNISGISLSSSEKAVLEKGLNFCPSSKEPDTNKTLNDLYSFCRKMRLKEHFLNTFSKTETTESNQTKIQQDRCELDVKIKKPYFKPPFDEHSPLNAYLIGQNLVGQSD